MSYYFAIIGTKDNPLFEHEFGTSKQGGDGIARFRDDARHMNQFIVHSSLDIVEEVQWTTGCMSASPFRLFNTCCFPLPTDITRGSKRYLKSIDRFHTSYISCLLTGGNIKLLLLHCPDRTAGATTINSTTNRPSTSSSNSIASNPTSPAAEEAIRQFFAEVYENWVKTLMNPFYIVNMPVTSPVFRQRVVAAGRKYL